VLYGNVTFDASGVWTYTWTMVPQSSVCTEYLFDYPETVPVWHCLDREQCFELFTLRDISVMGFVQHGSFVFPLLLVSYKCFDSSRVPTESNVTRSWRNFIPLQCSKKLECTDSYSASVYRYLQSDFKCLEVSEIACKRLYFGLDGISLPFFSSRSMVCSI
jgi:hypothetical protein